MPENFNKQARQVLLNNKKFRTFFCRSGNNVKSNIIHIYFFDTQNACYKPLYEFNAKTGVVNDCKNGNKFKMDVKTKILVKTLLFNDHAQDWFANNWPWIALAGAIGTVIALGEYADKKSKEEKEQYKQEIIEGVIKEIKKEQNAVFLEPQNQK